MFQKVGQGNETNPTSSQIHIGELEDFTIPLGSNDITHAHIHGIFRMQEQSAINFTIFHLVDWCVL
jgi:hypothetical protein